MTTDYNASEIDRLVREGREDDERMTSGPWKHDAGPGCRSIKGDKRGTRRQAQYRQVAFTVGLHDDEEDAANAAGIARTRNNLRATIDALSAAKAEVDKLRGEIAMLLANADADTHLMTDAIRDRDRLAAEVERLTKERDEARESVEFKEWFSSLRDQIDRGNSTAWAKLVKENTRLSARVRELEAALAERSR